VRTQRIDVSLVIKQADSDANWRGVVRAAASSRAWQYVNGSKIQPWPSTQNFAIAERRCCCQQPRAINEPASGTQRLPNFERRTICGTRQVER
jgi:hypothetical protein